MAFSSRPSCPPQQGAARQALDPAAGTALNLGVCYEKAGKLATAWAVFKTAEALAATANQRDRAALAKKRAGLLEPILSRLTIAVPQSSQIEGLAITRDGEPVQSPEWGVAVPARRWGSRHRGCRPWQGDVEGPRRPQGARADPSGRSAATRCPRPHGQSQDNAAQSESMSLAQKDSSSAVNKGNVATVVFGVGAAVALTGVVVWLTAPSLHSAVGTNGHELLLQGSF